MAKGWEDDTIPLVPYTTDRRLANLWKDCSGLLTFDQSILTGLDMFRSKRDDSMRAPDEKEIAWVYIALSDLLPSLQRDRTSHSRVHMG